MKPENVMKLTVDSRSSNESFVRVAVASFIAQLDPTVEEIADVKTAVSEGVTNCIVHGYRDGIGRIYITCELYGTGKVRIKIRDKGCGIPDIKRAREPLFTTSADGERAGLGFAVMETFMDKVSVRSTVGKGTTLTLQKQLAGKDADHG